MTTWTDLIIGCPTCVAAGKSLPPVQWTHADCGVGQMEVSDDAELRCKSCGELSRHHLSGWKFACSAQHDTYSHVYYEPEHPASSYAIQIAIAGQLAQLMGKEWLMRFIDNLEEE
jgi:hypothetical protein